MEISEEKRAQMEKLRKAIDSYEKEIFHFDPGDFLPYRPGTTKLNKGIYLTIRCGLSGIYMMANQWNEELGDWDIRVLDDSRTIAYKPARLKDIEDIVGEM